MDEKRIINPVEEAQNRIATPTAAMHEEFMLLMSLALDDALDNEERTQFDGYIKRYPTLAHQWDIWQELHQSFISEPVIAPPKNFTANVQTRLVQKERRRKLWIGATIGTVYFCLWASIILGFVSFGAFVITNQPTWLNDFVHNFAYLSGVVANWLEATFTTFNSVAATPQAIGIGLGYLLMTFVILALWTRFLQHSTKPVYETNF